MTAAQQEGPRRIAALSGRNPEESRALAAHLRQYEGLEPALFHPKDADELNDALRDGRFDLAVFPSLEALTIAICDAHADLHRWRAAGLQFEIAGRTDPENLATTLADIQAAVHSWQQRLRRRQTLAAIVLTALALAAMATLFWFIPPAK